MKMIKIILLTIISVIVLLSCVSNNSVKAKEVVTIAESNNNQSVEDKDDVHNKNRADVQELRERLSDGFYRNWASNFIDIFTYDSFFIFNADTWFWIFIIAVILSVILWAINSSFDNWLYDIHPMTNLGASIVAIAIILAILIGVLYFVIDFAEIIYIFVRLKWITYKELHWAWKTLIYVVILGISTLYTFLNRDNGKIIKSFLTVATSLIFVISIGLVIFL